MNIVIIEGRLGRDPEIRATQSGKSVASLSIASDYGYGERSGTLWDNVVSWDQIDFIQKLKKGSTVRVVGERQSRKWKTNDGEEKTVVEIQAYKISFAGSNKSSGQSRQSSAPQTRTQAPAAARPDPVAGTFITDEDLADIF